MYGAVRISSLITDKLFISVVIELIVGVIVYGGLSVAYLKIRQPKILKTIIKR